MKSPQVVQNQSADRADHEPFPAAFSAFMRRTYVVVSPYAIGKAALYFRVSRNDVKGWLEGTRMPSPDTMKRMMEKIEE